MDNAQNNHCVKRLDSDAMIRGMQIESSPGPLPLADALIAWSDPEVIEAIRRETAKLDPDLLARMDRYTLDSIRTERSTPRRGRILSLVPTGLSAFDRAWDRLFKRFRFMIEQGLVVVTGIDTLSIGRAERERIPAELASEMTFDPAGGAVFVGIHTYTNVVVSLGANGGEAPEMRSVMDAIPGTITPPAEPRSPPTNVKSDQVAHTTLIVRGRASFEPIIREAIDDRWDDIVNAVERGQSWLTIARWLWRHLDKKYPGWAHLKKLPSEFTIRTRLSRWYPGELANRTVQ